VVVSSVVEFILRRSPIEAFRVDGVDGLVAEFWKQEEWCFYIERSSVRVCDLILGLPSCQV
jgi:hypothetical protein